MTSGHEKQAAQKTPKSPIGAEAFGDGFCDAAVVTKELDSETLPLMAPAISSYDDGIEFLKSDTPERYSPTVAWEASDRQTKGRRGRCQDR